MLLKKQWQKNKKAQNMMEYFLIAILIVIPSMYALAPYTENLSALLKTSAPLHNSKARFDDIMAHLLEPPGTPVEFEDMNTEFFKSNFVEDEDNLAYFQTEDDSIADLFGKECKTKPFRGEAYGLQKDFTGQGYAYGRNKDRTFCAVNLKGSLPKINNLVEKGKYTVKNNEYTLDKGAYQLKFYNEGDITKYLSAEHSKLGDALIGLSVPADFQNFQLTTEELNQVIGSYPNDSYKVAYETAKVPTYYEYITMIPKDGNAAVTIRNPYYSGPSISVTNPNNLELGVPPEFLPIYTKDQ